MTTTLHNIYELSAAVLGNAHRDKKQSHVLAIIAKKVFRGSSYGVSLHQSGKWETEHGRTTHPEAIEQLGVSAIVEGTDIEIPEVQLQWPLDIEHFWKTVQSVNDAAADADADWQAQDAI